MERQFERHMSILLFCLIAGPYFRFVYAEWIEFPEDEGGTTSNVDIFLPEGSSGEDRRTSGGDETEHTNGKGVLFDEFSVNGNDTSREEDILCFNVRCAGEKCLYDFITRFGSNDSVVKTCSVSHSGVCFFEERPAVDGIIMVAGCAVDCDNPEENDGDTLPTTGQTAIGLVRTTQSLQSTGSSATTKEWSEWDEHGGTTKEWSEWVRNTEEWSEWGGNTEEWSEWGGNTGEWSEWGGNTEEWSEWGDTAEMTEDRSTTEEWSEWGNPDEWDDPEGWNVWHDPNSGNPDLRKRRKRSSLLRKKCCYDNFCNHDSPCGSLTCSAGLLSLQIWLLCVIFIFCIYPKY